VKRISSRRVWLLKWGIPVFLSLWLVGATWAFVAGAAEADEWVFAAVSFAIFALVYSMTYRDDIKPLADRVEDAGDDLVVHRRGVQARIPFSEIVSVTNEGGQPPRIALRLRSAGPFGDEVVFLAPSGLRLPFALHPLLKDLAARVDRAHGEGGE
jgi:hypothetical protein